MDNIFWALIVARSSLDIFTDVIIGPLKLNIPSLVSIYVLILAFFYFVLKGSIRTHRISKIFGIWIISLLPFVIISINNFGKDGLIAVREWVRLFTIFVVFVVFYNLKKKYNIQKVVSIFMVSLIIPISVGLYQFITNSGLVVEHEGVHRIYGTFAHPNSFAFYLVFFIGLTYWKSITTGNKFYLFLILVEIFILTTTLSIGGFFALCVLFFLLVIKHSKKYKLLLVSFMILFGVILVNTPQFHKRLDIIKKIDLKAAINEEKVVDSFTWRIVNWMQLLSVWNKKPITGYGLHTTQFINPWKTIEGLGYAPHNDFIRYLVETGIVGLCFFIFFIVYCGYCLFKGYLSYKDQQLKFLLYTLLSIYICWQIISIVGNVITDTTFQFYFWALCGFALNQRKMLTDRNENEISNNLSNR